MLNTTQGIGTWPLSFALNLAYDFSDHNIATVSAYWIELMNELLSPTYP